MNLPEPDLGIVRDRTRQLGLETLGQLGPEFVLENMPLHAALRNEFEFDAHFVQYRAVDEDGQPFYLRINKRAPASHEIEERGGRVEITTIGLDWDIDPKGTWKSKAQVQEFVAALSAKELPEPTAFYTTRGGCRFVYQLSRPVSPSVAEGIMRGLIRDFTRQGLALDTRCKDWTRLFRLPQVLRDGLRTSQAPYFELLLSDATLDPDSIEPGESKQDEEYAPVELSFAPNAPTPEACAALLEHEGKKTAWYKTAQRYLKGREAFPYIFEAAPVDWRPGTRDDTLTRMVGSACGLLFPREGSTPEGVFALFSDVVDQLVPDSDTPNWREKGWGLVTRMWGAESSKARANEIRQELREEEALDARAKIVQVMRRLYPDERALADASEAVAWTDRRLIAVAPKGYYVMRPDGSYSPIGVSKDALVPTITHLGMSELIQTTELKNNVWKTRDAQSILNQHGIPVKRVEGSPQADFGQIVGDNDEERILRVRIHKLRDLEPRFDPDVDGWLRVFFGDRYPEGCTWLAHALDVSWGICGIVLIGASGAGKGMFAQGLAECFQHPMFNDGRALGKHNQGLLENPVVVLDEGIPQINEGRTVDEVIRSLTVGGTVSIEPKFVDVIKTQMYPRMVMTANTWDVLQKLVGSRDLSEEDIYALETRLLVIPVSDEARRWLTARGNEAFTQGWVAGRVPSQFRLARHIRYLYERRTKAAYSSGRLLVEGSRNTDLMRSMSMRTPAAQVTMRTVVNMIEDGSAGLTGFHIDPSGRVWVVPHGIVHYYERRLQQHMKLELSPKAVGRVLRKLCKSEPLNATSLPGMQNGAKQRWWEISLPSLMYEAMQSGQPRERLRKLYEQQHGPEALAMIESSFDSEQVRHG